MNKLSLTTSPLPPLKGRSWLALFCKVKSGKDMMCEVYQ